VISHQPYETRVAAILLELGIPASYGSDSGVPLQREATDLLSIGADIYGRDQRLTPDAATRWQATQAAAAQQGVSLLLVSAFRSVDYQRKIWERKLAAGESVAQILRVSAPPGYSEHHTGRAIDLTASGCEALTEDFEGTPEFAWLAAHAGAFGFSMPYSRHNRYGFIFEPWHWSANEIVAYDEIGIGYASRRTSDPRIFECIRMALSSCATVLNVGGGAGSYEPPTCILAVEPSQRMIEQRPPGLARCIRAAAEHLPLEDKSFDGALASLTIHHWKDVRAGLAEMCRVTRKRIVLFTWDPEFEADYWLTRDYFPAILELDRPRFPTLRGLEAMLHRIDVQTVPISADCQDGFIGAFWKRPEAFLDPEVVRANSAMAQLDPQKLQDGLGRLRDDLRTGAWWRRNPHLAAQNELDLGYRLVISDQI
jgi:SAM-dependent methyltransferase